MAMSASENELSEPDPPVLDSELPFQQHQPDVDLENEVPAWYKELEEGGTLTQKESGGYTRSPHRHRRKRSRVLESSSESSEDEESPQGQEQTQKKGESSEDEMKTLIKTLFKKVEKNEKLLKFLVHSWFFAGYHESCWYTRNWYNMRRLLALVMRKFV